MGKKRTVVNFLLVENSEELRFWELAYDSVWYYGYYLYYSQGGLGNFLRLGQWVSNSLLFHNIFCYPFFSDMNVAGIFPMNTSDILNWQALRIEVSIDLGTFPPAAYLSLRWPWQFFSFWTRCSQFQKKCSNLVMQLDFFMWWLTLRLKSFYLAEVLFDNIYLSVSFLLDCYVPTTLSTVV